MSKEKEVKEVKEQEVKAVEPEKKEEKKSIRQKMAEKKEAFVEKHPKAAKRISTVGEVGTGVVLGVIAKLGFDAITDAISRSRLSNSGDVIDTTYTDVTTDNSNNS
jgi:hypothetical protein